MLRCVALCCVFFRTRSFAAFRSSRLVFGFGTTIIWKKIYKNKYNNGMSNMQGEFHGEGLICNNE